MATNCLKTLALAAIGGAALLATGCNPHGDQVQTSFGVSGSANPGGPSTISTTVPGPEAGAGGSGLTDTRGTAMTGAKAGAGTPQLGETGNLPLATVPSAVEGGTAGK